METGFFGLCKELSHFNHNKYQKTGGRSPTAQWYVLWKKFWHLYTCFIMSWQFLDRKGANSWSLFAYETKSVGKQDFTKPKLFHSKHHRVKSIAKYKAGSGRNPGDWQFWKLWYPQPQDRCSQRAGTLKTVENCTTEFHRKKSNFPINEELFSKFQWDQKLLFSSAHFLKGAFFWKVLKGTVYSPNILNADSIYTSLDIWLWVEKSIIWNCISWSGDRVIPGN